MAGKLEHAIVDPQRNEVTEFVVSTGGLFGKDVIVPREEIEQATAEADALRLRLDKEQLRQLPEYEPVDYSGPPQGWLPSTGYGFPHGGYLWPIAPGPRIEAPTTAAEPWEAPHAVSIDKGSAVLDRDGTDVGVVEDVRLASDNDRLEGFDVRLGGRLRTLFPGGDVLYVGAELVGSVEPKLVRLRVAKEELAASGR